MMIKFSASAPGSLMLFGEHAVLHGKLALCCAVDQRIQVTLTAREDQQVHLYSPTLGEHTVSLTDFSIKPPFEFILTAIDQFRSRIHQGFNLTIQAGFASTMGLGSSSAVTVATVGVLGQWLQLRQTPLELFQEAKTVVLRVQGLGSGADVAAAVFGGVVAYRAEPLEIQPIAVLPPLALVYSGAKIPTRTVVEWVAAKQELEPARYQLLYDKMDYCTRQALAALQQSDWRALGSLMNQHHALQAALGVSTPLLDEIASILCHEPDIHGAKISGSGLGDCVVGLGVMADNVFPANTLQKTAGVQPVPVKISALGYKTEILENVTV